MLLPLLLQQPQLLGIAALPARQKKEIQEQGREGKTKVLDYFVNTYFSILNNILSLLALDSTWTTFVSTSSFEPTPGYKSGIEIKLIFKKY